MDLRDYVHEAARTDGLGCDEDAIRIALFGIGGEAGEVISEAKKYFRDGGPTPGLRDRVGEELGDLLWYVALLARRLGLDLEQVAQQNLDKTGALWSADLPPLPNYDAHTYDEQKLLRRMTIEFQEERSGELAVARMIPTGQLAERVNVERQRKMASGQLGDTLDDNAALDDGYRYHDIIHLGHATVLGWSPVLRALMGAKRRDVGDCDRVQDGARAIAIEEGLAAFVFNYLEAFDFAPDAIGWDLFKHVRRTVRGLEVADQPMIAWRHAYTHAFKILVQLNQARGGVVECDLDTREMRLVAQPGMDARQLEQ